MTLLPNHSPRLAAILLVACLLGGCSEPVSQTFEFAVMGDAPYSPENVERVHQLIREVNAQDELQWIIHVGDIKGGSSPCDDTVLEGRLGLFDEFELPFFFTPGDNDWYDCVRDTAGAWNRAERLSFLRSLFFTEPTSSSAGAEMSVRSQSADPEYSEFVENQLWARGKVTIATVHMLRVTPPDVDSLDATRRMAAASAWIQEAFRTARENKHIGVFMATQVDPWPWMDQGPVAGIESLYDLLIRESSQFDGQVVLAVGDTHIYRVDKPLYAEGTLVPNFTRMEVFGDPVVGWVQVSVDPASDQVFSFKQEIIE